MDFIEKARIMDGPRINRALARLASEVVEENHGADDLYLVGITNQLSIAQIFLVILRIAISS